MLILNILLYLIALIFLLTIIYKTFKVYLIVNDYIASNVPKQILTDLKKCKINFKGVNIYFEFQDLLVSDHKYAKIHIKQINGKINILSSIILGRVKVNNMILKDLDLAVNSIRKQKKIPQISANVVFNTEFNKFAKRIINLSAMFNLENIDFNLDTIFSVKNEGLSLISLSLHNRASNLRDVFYYLPETFINKKLLNWLDDSLLSGSISNSELFVDSDHNFNLTMAFKDVNLQYSKNWPIIEKLSAKMEIFDNNLKIYMDDGSNKGYILQQPFLKLQAELKDINADLLKPLFVTAEIKKLKFDLIFDGKSLLVNNNFFNAKVVLADQGEDFILEKLMILNKEFTNIKFTNDFKKNSWHFKEQNTKGDIVILNSTLKLSCQGLHYNIEATSDVGKEIDNPNDHKPEPNSKQRVVYVNGKFSSNNFGSLLDQLSTDQKIIQGGNGLITFNLKIKDELLELSNNFEGIFKVDLRSGNIIGVDPGLGRIIGLFNLANIPRRLQLDFSDLTGKGFNFDYIKGDLNIKNGKLLFNNVVINGPSANLTINGSTCLITKKIDLLIDAKSKVSSTLPLAAAIASGNPVVGAALWWFDHASGDEIGKIRIQKYKILGTWDKPEINQI